MVGMYSGCSGLPQSSYAAAGCRPLCDCAPRRCRSPGPLSQGLPPHDNPMIAHRAFEEPQLGCRQQHRLPSHHSEGELADGAEQSAQTGQTQHVRASRSRLPAPAIPPGRLGHGLDERIRRCKTATRCRHPAYPGSWDGFINSESGGEFIQAASGWVMSWTNLDCRVWARWVPASHSPTRRTLIATAVATCPRWVPGQTDVPRASQPQRSGTLLLPKQAEQRPDRDPKVREISHQGEQLRGSDDAPGIIAVLESAPFQEDGLHPEVNRLLCRPGLPGTSNERLPSCLLRHNGVRATSGPFGTGHAPWL